MDNERRQEFWNLISTSEKPIDFSSFERDVPASLFRYRPITDKSINALRMDRLYFSTSNYYDDPFDTLIFVDKKRLHREIDELALDKIDRRLLEGGLLQFGIDATSIDLSAAGGMMHSFVEALYGMLSNALKKDIFTVCFGESGTNEQLWLKYANQYKGFVIEYDFKSLLHGNKDVFDSKNACIDGTLVYSYPVSYSDERFDATNYFKNLVLCLAGRPDLVGNPIRMAMDRHCVCLHKGICHSNDQEWRLIIDAPMPSCPSYMVVMPKSILLGLRIGPMDKENLLAIGKEKGIPIYETYITDEYRLEKKLVS